MNISKQHRELFTYYGIPKKHWDVRLGELPESEYKKEIEEWVLNFKDKLKAGKGLYLYGPYGTGKSAIGSMLLRAAAANRIPGLWLNYKELQSISINVNDHMFSSDMTMMGRIMTVDFLFVDEFQIKNNQHWSVDKLDDIIRQRFQSELTTVIASNVSPADLVKKEMCGSLADFLREAVSSLMISGKDFRGLKR